ncbi:MAG: hypothetical protein KGI33_06020 [Thaumarchaeota archaeon]|nr:hypothetical protein [Nitrososphaerota archaeon]
MKQKKYIYAGIVAAAAIAAVLIITQFGTTTTVNTGTGPSDLSPYLLDYTYETVNSDLRDTLKGQGINMSKPLTFQTPSEINQYCNFLSNKTKQAMIVRCTSTEIKDENSQFLGNLNMVGAPIAPVLVVATAQTDPMFGNYKDIKLLFGDVINETVCHCWAKEKPGGYGTISAMMDALRDFHLKGKKPNSTTQGVPLEGKHFEIELTTNPQGYLWKLLVAK